jgi:hypothetical protein
MIDPVETRAYLTAAISALDILKTGLGLLPKGANKDALAKKIEEAEEALKRSDAKLAKELGYKLCKCTFPLQIMLWREQGKAYVCPSIGNAISGRSARPKLSHSLKSNAQVSCNRSYRTRTAE